MKASVFPEPVLAAPSMSLPLTARPMDSRCMSVGFSNLALASP